MAVTSFNISFRIYYYYSYYLLYNGVILPIIINLFCICRI